MYIVVFKDEINACNVISYFDNIYLERDRQMKRQDKPMCLATFISWETENSYRID